MKILALIVVFGLGTQAHAVNKLTFRVTCNHTVKITGNYDKHKVNIILHRYGTRLRGIVPAYIHKFLNFFFNPRWSHFSPADRCNLAGVHCQIKRDICKKI